MLCEEYRIRETPDGRFFIERKVTVRRIFRAPTEDWRVCTKSGAIWRGHPIQIAVTGTPWFLSLPEAQDGLRRIMRGTVYHGAGAPECDSK